MDQRFLNCKHAPIVSPLLKPMRIELYNDKWLQPNGNDINTTSPHINLPSSELDAIAFAPHAIPPTLSMDELNNGTHPIPEVCQSIVHPISPPGQVSLHSKILDSSDRLFFMEYTPAGTMLRKWYLVQVDIDASASLRQDYVSSGLYYCSFLAKHPGDIKLSDEHSRWWPDWYRYSRDSVTHDIIFGARILFRPSVLPDSTKYIRWSDELKLAGSDKILMGPFNFERISLSNRTRSKVSLANWRILYEECLSRGLLPPTIGTTTFNASSSASVPRKTRKRKLSYQKS